MYHWVPLSHVVDEMDRFAYIRKYLHTMHTTNYHNFRQNIHLRFFSINRYYLEPASPLKSLTNTTQFGFSQLNGSTQSKSSLENGNHHNSNSSTYTNGTAQLWSLSPPTSLKLNGNNKTLPAPPSINNFQEQFTPDDNSLFNQNGSNGSSCTTAATVATNGTSLSNSLTNNINMHHHQNGISHVTNGNGVTSNGGCIVNGNGNANHYLMNGFSRPTASASNQNVITKNSLNLQQSAAILENSNKFTPDTDFVADFSSANIFNAQTTTTTKTTNAVGMVPPPPSTASTLKATANVTNGTNINNNNSEAFNGNGTMTNGNGTNGISTNGFDDGSDANANFADFEHNTIYNAAGECTHRHTISPPFIPVSDEQSRCINSNHKLEKMPLVAARQ